jgi:hypothetical protein
MHLAVSIAYSRLLLKGWRRGSVEIFTIFAFKLQLHCPDESLALSSAWSSALLVAHLQLLGGINCLQPTLA